MFRCSTKFAGSSILFASFIFTFSGYTYGQRTDQIATYNIQYDIPPEYLGPWSNRAPHAINLIRFHEMDILGPEEGIYNQTEYSSSEFKFPQLGTESDELDSKHVRTPVFYNPEKFELLEHSSFGLSSSPSKGKSNEGGKICTWGKFKSKEGKEFYVFNIHFGTNENMERPSSKKIILKKINDINKEHLPCILTGDFNLSETSLQMNENMNNEILDEKSSWNNRISAES
jgi:endonuclease/exonuclease/phosphatase family metal-dependent hydrolase